MAKKRNKANDSSNKESIEEKVLKKYRKYKKEVESSDEPVDERVDEPVATDFNTNSDYKLINHNIESESKINEDDQISAQNIFKKVNKIKCLNNKNAKKERKKFKKKLAVHKTDDNVGKESDKSSNALKYLNDWKYNRNEWKFKKNYQIWLIKNWNNINRICDQDFDLFIDYIESINNESFAKKRLEIEAKNIINKEEVEVEEHKDEDKQKYDRARKILQCFV